MVYLYDLRNTFNICTIRGKSIIRFSLYSSRSMSPFKKLFLSFLFFTFYLRKMSFRSPAKNTPKPKAPVKRYRAGQVPENYVDELSDSEEEYEEQQQQQKQPQTTKAELTFAQKEVRTGIKQTTISEQEASTDRRLRRLQQLQLDDQDRSARRRHVQDDDEDEQEKARERMRLKQRALEQQDALVQNVEEDEEEEEEQKSEEEEESSEYESSSEEEDTLARLPKPVFIPK